ncbi:MAG: cytochrome C [Chloroflexi bacterium RBG_16_58_14]|nr:MAG: cytochrome C [Chloroflexi bacterium RBG_16_58_14]
MIVLLPDGSKRPLGDYLFPSAILMLAALMLMVSMFLPYWSMKMIAPQYPKGLTVDVYINHLEGDVREVDALNHYLGMPPLDEGGRLERSISLVAIVILGLLLMAAVFVGNQWAAVLALPVLAFPLIFLADLWLILYQYGHSIDPESALGSAIEPFTPPLFGVGKIGQFGTVSSAEIGLYLAIAAGIVVLVGLWFHRAAYKPIVDARKKAGIADQEAPSA